MPEPITAETIYDLLDRKYNDWEMIGGQWFGIRELRLGAGFSAGHERRIDYFAIHCHPSRQHRRLAFEIKISRADFRRELKQPGKRRLALMYSNEFYFVAPDGVIPESELPPECGLIIADPAAHWRSRLKIRVRAASRDTLPPAWSLFVSAVRAERRRNRDLPTP